MTLILSYSILAGERSKNSSISIQENGLPKKRADEKKHIWNKKQELLPSSNFLESAGDNEIGMIHRNEICCKLA